MIWRCMDELPTDTTLSRLLLVAYAPSATELEPALTCGRCAAVPLVSAATPVMLWIAAVLTLV
ncbi:hypothetical protein, partial [Geobacillus sp. LEMMJ02]|uniref:hypothetical protein n=1 Tax=Geobacillus sp. LEMMJ02 TaxID=2595057 RepID=UPI00272DAB30